MITVLIGAQFGSEGKGLVAGAIAGSYNVHVRVGAANAGHTVWVDGEKHVVQQLPCAAYANPWAQLVLGAGAMISPSILARELVENRNWRLRKRLPAARLIIDQRAHVILPQHIEWEQASGLAERIGSTSTIAREGIGAAQAARVMRTGYKQIRPFTLEPFGIQSGDFQIADTVALLHDAMIFDSDILLEGTQGTGLCNVTGFYPYVTSRNTTASGLAADCGIGPRQVDSVLLVARTYPIRVAGPSGPFWGDSQEVSWQDLGVDPEQERTTVTRKIRRVATFSYEQIKHAARVNSASEIALTFTDYLAPNLAGQSGVLSAEAVDQVDYVGQVVRRIEQVTDVPVTMLGTGPETVINRISEIGVQGLPHAAAGIDSD